MYQLQQPDDSSSVPITRSPYNPHSLEEFRRLQILHRHLYHLMGGLLPRAFDHNAFRARFRDRFGSYYRVLDIGCGAGGWVLDMVRTNPETVVYGIDTDAYLIKQAKEHARREGLHEARFRVQQLDDLSWSEDMHMDQMDRSI